MNDIKKEKAVRTARNPQSILKGILSLPLNDKVEILRELNKNIENEVTALQAAADEAAKLVKGL